MLTKKVIIPIMIILLATIVYGLSTSNMGNVLIRGNLTVNESIFGSGDNVRIGDAGTDSHSLTADDDLFVSGKQEVDGQSYFDGIVNFFSTIGTAIDLNGNNLNNVNEIDGNDEIITMQDNTTFEGTKDTHYGKVDINNILNPQAEIKQGDTNNLLLFNRTIDGTHIIFDSPQGLNFKFIGANITTNFADTKT